MKILITGSDGLIGGALVEYFDSIGWEVYGADNNSRKKFFGEGGDTQWNRHRIFHMCKNYHPSDIDITNPDDVWSLFHRGDDNPVIFEYDAIVHCAAQPSHDYASEHPDIDFKVNVTGTQNLLDAVRKFNKNAVFIFMSTNKVYDDYVNKSRIAEGPTRYQFVFDGDSFGEAVAKAMRGPHGFDESTPVGASNVFGSDKLAADQMVQRYAQAYGMKTMVLRGGCLTGPGHSGVPQHGFLNYLIRAVASGKTYQVFGYKGKQVRDNIHSYDVATAIHEMIKNPRPGQVYNIGGGYENSISILEAIAKAGKITGKRIEWEYLDKPRSGDHIWYVTDMSKFKRDYPNWKITKSLDDIFNETFKQYYWGAYSDHEDTKTYPLNEDSIVIDVGGYRGAWTASILEKYNPKRIYIFEPVPEFYEDCQRRFKDNPNVDVIPRGLSNYTGNKIIAKQAYNSSMFRGSEGQKELPVDSVYGAVQPEIIRLLDIKFFLNGLGIENIDLISINCEGGEYDILDRLIETGNIGKFKNVQVQFHDFHPDAVNRRKQIRKKLLETHTESFNYPFVWESWKRKEST